MTFMPICLGSMAAAMADLNQQFQLDWLIAKIWQSLVA
jgi:hypothetical protein